ncbi:MAG: hypothetical protein M1832_000307 [Thelocarpon impressellum]|nr:MAG: hypothetical protein M1832_000307 [Thelocarpon impressellum]
MADPFEVRMRFTSQLQHLNASVTSSQRAAHYALKNRDMDEDLHSCILEQLERNSMNNRANIMYFIEHFCDMATRENHLEFVRMMQRDILRVVDAVAPEDGSGAANVKVVRKVLANLQHKSFLLPQTVAEIEACLESRDVLPTHAALSPVHPSGSTNNASSTATAPPQQASQSNPLSSSTPRTATSTHTPRGGKPNGSAAVVHRLDKRQIEQRIEEDRERHKRLRESIWAVDNSAADAGDGEFGRLWREGSEVGDDDYLLAEEERAERRAAAAGLEVA